MATLARDQARLAKLLFLAHREFVAFVETVVHPRD